MASASASRDVKASNAAISTVQAPGQALLHAAHGGLGEDAAVGTHEPLAVLARRGLGIDVGRVEAGNAGDRARASASSVPRTSSRFEAGSVETQEDPAPPLGEGDGARAGERRLAHPALSREEQDAGRRIEEGPGVHQQQPPSPQPQLCAPCPVPAATGAEVV